MPGKLSIANEQEQKSACLFALDLDVKTWLSYTKCEFNAPKRAIYAL